MLKKGKLPNYLLNKLLNRFVKSTVMVGPKVGEDAAIVSISNKDAAIFSTDPITFARKTIGHYLLNINANDIAACGGVPKYFLITLLFPEGTKEKEIKNLFSEIQKECLKMKIEILGGHTEITGVVKDIIGVGVMVGLAKKDKLTPTKAARPGDKILFIKQIAIEGTAIIFREKEKELKSVFPQKIIKRGKNLLFNPGISILKAAKILNQNCKVRAMHDPTEGGIANALWEISQAARVKILAEEKKIPINEETRSICNYYHLDPLYLIASGSLLATLSKREAEKGIKILRKNKISATIIGEVKRGKGAWFIRENKFREIIPKEDEITKINLMAKN